MISVIGSIDCRSLRSTDPWKLGPDPSLDLVRFHLASPHVLIHGFLVTQVVGDDRVDVTQIQRRKLVYDFLRSAAVVECVDHPFQRNTGVHNPKYVTFGESEWWRYRR